MLIWAWRPACHSGFTPEWMMPSSLNAMRFLLRLRRLDHHLVYMSAEITLNRFAVHLASCYLFALPHLLLIHSLNAVLKNIYILTLIFFIGLAFKGATVPLPRLLIEQLNLNVEISTDVFNGFAFFIYIFLTYFKLIWISIFLERETRVLVWVWVRNGLILL